MLELFARHACHRSRTLSSTGIVRQLTWSRPSSVMIIANHEISFTFFHLNSVVREYVVKLVFETAIAV